MTHIRYVVEPRREADDVLPVERGDEGLVQMPDDLVIQLVAVMLDRVDVAHLVFDVREVAQKLGQGLSCLDRVLGVLPGEMEMIDCVGKIPAIERSLSQAHFHAGDGDLSQIHATGVIGFVPR